MAVERPPRGEGSPHRARRAAVHRALADEGRLGIVDALRLGDRTPGDLVDELAIASNLLSHHLEVLEEAGVVTRHRSSGDGRRRYVQLLVDDPLPPPAGLPSSTVAAPAARSVLFVCTRNAARSQLASALWTRATGRPSSSAGSDPAAAVDAGAVEVAAAHGLVLDDAQPRSYAEVPVTPDLVVSVCDRACEQGLPFTAPRLHWSVTDPHGGGRQAYEDAFDHIRRRVHRLASAV